MTYSPPTQYATEKQTAFIKSLLEQRVVTAEVKDYVEGFIVSGTMTKQEASKRIEWLLAQPKVEKPKPVYADVPEGMHISPETGMAVKVYKTRNGHQVASFLREIDGAWGFEYQGKRGLKGLSEATRMPAEEAAKFGKTYGICINCAAHLTDERSIFAGYGPVCAKNNGWAYPTKDEAMAGLGVGIYADSILTEPEPFSTFSDKTTEEVMAELAKSIPEQPDDFDEVAEEGKEISAFGKAWAEGGTIGLSEAEAGMEEAAKALESFAEILKEHAIIPPKEHDLAGGGGPIIKPPKPPSLVDDLLPENLK